MIDYIRGILTEKQITQVSVEAHGVGYAVSIPLSTYERLPAPGVEVKLHIHYHVREDAHKLYGFFTRAEREMFRKLISVSQVGPKVGMSVLSGISVDDLIRSVTLGDSSRLEKVPGIGGKTAQRLVMELRGKLGSVDVGSTASGLGAGAAPGVQGGARQEAYAAMISLGYNDKQVGKALSRVEQVTAPAAPVEEWIKKALQVI